MRKLLRYEIKLTMAARKYRRFIRAVLAALAEFGRVLIRSQRQALTGTKPQRPQRPQWPAAVLEQHHPDDGGFE